MGYDVAIKPGKKPINKPDMLDAFLKHASDEVLGIGANIYVCGRHGCGKTSVLKYMAKMVPSKQGNIESYVGRDKVLYLSADDLISAIVNGVRYNNLSEFRSMCQNANVIIVDDIDRLVCKESTQIELVRMIEHNDFIILSGVYPVEDCMMIDSLKGKLESFTVMEITENAL